MNHPQMPIAGTAQQYTSEYLVISLEYLVIFVIFAVYFGILRYVCNINVARSILLYIIFNNSAPIAQPPCCAISHL